ncbi:helix-turn-helix domain-containing protein [Pseudemcibacter aquimaris]|uniref:helix-turn-helix domain-containing protein n=1 Tax=Pseudemcibacter aquimaris TaxID=2857064 RepID=UPI002011805C|nr:helix-turn-helix domain-containing protein [Pseudemcibacter aquimaris]MCC3859661.1 helix-turn-helix domain-containing protein [Pseudemcibacter aquimaris]WDU60056.1 helix-turn-helix domain-containing protein [Pseudemcibacter aquimaris]
MDFNITTVTDIFFRVAAVGQLFMFFTILIRPNSFSRYKNILLLGLCIASYLLLSAPIADEQYGFLRNILLIFTDYMAFAFWLVIYPLFNQFPAKKIMKYLFAGIFAGNIIFFGFTDGDGFYHVMVHWISLFLLFHCIYMAISGLNDDLMDQRRKFRVWFTGITCLIFSIIAYSEIFDDSIRHTPAFSALISIGFFILIAYMGRILISPSLSDILIVPDSNKNPNINDIPNKYKAHYNALNKFMSEGGYRQENLSIKNLSYTLSIPEHQLRYLINSCLGYRNFSTYLNEYRIKEACERLKDENEASTQILTIAMDLGYGSVGSFNRAFRNETGKSPREFKAKE